MAHTYTLATVMANSVHDIWFVTIAKTYARCDVVESVKIAKYMWYTQHSTADRDKERHVEEKEKQKKRREKKTNFYCSIPKFSNV